MTGPAFHEQKDAGFGLGRKVLRPGSQRPGTGGGLFVRQQRVKSHRAQRRHKSVQKITPAGKREVLHGVHSVRAIGRRQISVRTKTRWN